jgi:uncharacterized transporter YbjL
MAKTKQKRTKARQAATEQDSAYFLKLVLYLILGSLWIKITQGDTRQFPLPIGLVVGLILVQHEHFQIDRKIEYAVLLLAMFLGFWMPFGIYISM